jgi:cell division protein FtsI (penicillin-binding protein 3)
MLANDGVALRPHLVQRIGDGPTITPVAHRELPLRVVRQLREMLKSVVTAEGTGGKAAIPGYVVAGKTGTTQKVVNGRYSKKHYIGWFVGFAPADRPRVVTLVMVDDPHRGSFYGGDTAAPSFARLTARALQSLGVPRQG